MNDDVVIRWRSKSTGATGHGEPMTRADADAWIERQARAAPELLHWGEIMTDDAAWHALERARAITGAGRNLMNDPEYPHIKPHLIDLCRTLMAEMEADPADEERAELLEEVRGYLPRAESP